MKLKEKLQHIDFRYDDKGRLALGEYMLANEDVIWILDRDGERKIQLEFSMDEFQLDDSLRKLGDLPKHSKFVIERTPLTEFADMNGMQIFTVLRHFDSDEYCLGLISNTGKLYCFVVEYLENWRKFTFSFSMMSSDDLYKLCGWSWKKINEDALPEFVYLALGMVGEMIELVQDAIAGAEKKEKEE
jgi:hypothetical protein